jgi:hypothetical protein
MRPSPKNRATSATGTHRSSAGAPRRTRHSSSYRRPSRPHSKLIDTADGHVLRRPPGRAPGPLARELCRHGGPPPFPARRRRPTRGPRHRRSSGARPLETRFARPSGATHGPHPHWGSPCDRRGMRRTRPAPREAPGRSPVGEGEVSLSARRGPARSSVGAAVGFSVAGAPSAGIPPAEAFLGSRARTRRPPGLPAGRPLGGEVRAARLPNGVATTDGAGEKNQEGHEDDRSLEPTTRGRARANDESRGFRGTRGHAGMRFFGRVGHRRSYTPPGGVHLPRRPSGMRSPSSPVTASSAAA